MSYSETFSMSDDEYIQDLLRQAGSRIEPSEDARRQVYAATFDAWRSTVADRTAQRRRTWSIAASVAALAVAVGFVALRAPWQETAVAPVTVASIVRVDGQLQAARDGSSDFSVRTVGQSLAVGESLRTDVNTRAALNFGDNFSIRLDQGTTVTVLSEDRLRLDRGGIYFDAAPNRHSPFAVETAAATIRHLGTQYSVHTVTDGVDVGVREGHVLIALREKHEEGGAGERIHVSQTGDVVRSALPAQDAYWHWTEKVAPPFDIDGRSLSSFLEWLARETGRKLVYASSEAQAAADAVKLRGSISGLDLNKALDAVLSTTQLHRYDTKADTLGIALTEHAH